MKSPTPAADVSAISVVVATARPTWTVIECLSQGRFAHSSTSHFVEITCASPAEGDPFAVDGMGRRGWRAKREGGGCATERDELHGILRDDMAAHRRGAGSLSPCSVARAGPWCRRRYIPRPMPGRHGLAPDAPVHQIAQDGLHRLSDRRGDDFAPLVGAGGDAQAPFNRRVFDRDGGQGALPDIRQRPALGDDGEAMARVAPSTHCRRALARTASAPRRRRACRSGCAGNWRGSASPAAGGRPRPSDSRAGPARRRGR
ncbi:MAG: hypothetical protein ACJA1L_001345 [Paracoccaceae bacterium]|jgi:hypothetical protein